MYKYVKVKNCDKCLVQDIFQKENQGKIFRVLKEDKEFYYIDNSKYYNKYYKDRFLPHSLVNLPDELFRI